MKMFHLRRIQERGYCGDAASIKDSTEKLYKKLSKVFSMANPAHGLE